MSAALRALEVPEPYPSKKTGRAEDASRVKLLRTRLAQGVHESQMDAVLAAVRPLVKPDTTDGETVSVFGFATEEPPRENLVFCENDTTTRRSRRRSARASSTGTSCAAT